MALDNFSVRHHSRGWCWRLPFIKIKWKLIYYVTCYS